MTTPINISTDTSTQVLYPLSENYSKFLPRRFFGKAVPYKPAPHQQVSHRHIPNHHPPLLLLLTIFYYSGITSKRTHYMLGKGNLKFRPSLSSKKRFFASRLSRTCGPQTRCLSAGPSPACSLPPSIFTAFIHVHPRTIIFAAKKKKKKI